MKECVAAPIEKSESPVRIPVDFDTFTYLQIQRYESIFSPVEMDK